MIKVAAPNMALPGDRLGDPGARRGRRLRGLPARRACTRRRARCASPTARRGAPQPDRHAGARAPWLSRANAPLRRLAPGGSAQPRRCPQTSLWYNLEVSATRYPDKAAFICYDNAMTLRAPQGRGARRSPASCRSAAAWPRATACCSSRRTASQFVIALLRDPARRRGGGADQPDEPHRGAAPLREGLRREGRGRRAGAVAAGRAARRGRHASSTRSSPPTRTTCTKPTDLKVPDAFKLAAPADRRRRT